MTTYTATIQETDEAVGFLVDQKYNLALAKQVIDGSGESATNTIFQTRKVVNNTSISWSVTYGVNWTAEIPTPGAKVVESGKWQKCALGQAFTLVDGGLWENNTTDGKDGYLTVRNDYDKVNILVGQQNPENPDHWQVIYFSPSQLSDHGLGSYKPLEKISIWYGNQQNTGFVIGKQQTQVATYTYDSDEKNNEHWFQWSVKDFWSDQNHSFPSNDHSFLPPINTRWIKFAIALGSAAATTQWITAFKVQMDEKGWEATVTGTTSIFDFHVEAKKKQEEEAMDGSVNGVAVKLDEAIDQSLKQNLKDGKLPVGETWRITYQ